MPATSCVKIPTCSSASELRIQPVIGIRRQLDLKPTIPQKAAGRIVEPMTCVPIASGQKPAATAAAEPPLDPPGESARLGGLRGGPGAQTANAAVTELAR